MQMAGICTEASLALWLALLLCVSCRSEPEETDAEENWSGEHEAMLDQIKRYGVRDKRVLEAMRKVRRHVYIPESKRRGLSNPYGDHPCDIGYGQTISQPYIVAYMTERMKLEKGEKVLEIGTGSGYQAAILAEMGAEVYSIEIVPELAEHARQVLKQEKHGGVRVLTGDGYRGWPEHAPFDAIIVTCAPEEIPAALVEQLKDGGRMILPLGKWGQRLVILRKKGRAVEKEEDIGVRFVPMVRGGEHSGGNK